VAPLDLIEQLNPPMLWQILGGRVSAFCNSLYSALTANGPV